MAIPKKEHELWSKLLVLPLDHLAEEPAPETGFIKRLAREEKWSSTTALRVRAEYRRFLLLAHLGPASPSRRVDAAWHLHLTYTRAYNIGLCERTLGRPLDHTPGSSVEDSRHYASLYEDTLNRYRAVFDQEPPPDIWPAVELPKRKRRNKFSAAMNLVVSLVLVVVLFLWGASRSIILGLFMAGAMVLAMAMDHHRRRSKEESGCGGGCGSGGDGGGDGGGSCGGCGGGCS